MGNYTLLIGGLRGHPDDLWPITGALRLLHQAAIDIERPPLAQHPEDWSQYFKTFILSEGGYLEIEKKQATWMFHDDIKGASSTAEMLKNVFDYFKEHRDCGMVYIEECLEEERFDEINEGEYPPDDIYDIKTFDLREDNDDDVRQPTREITFLNERYIPADKREKDTPYPMTVAVLEKKTTGPFLGYHLYGNPEALHEWLSSNPPKETRNKVATTLLAGMDIEGVKAVLKESPGAKAAETAIFPLQQFLRHHEPRDLTLQTIIYSLRKAQYELETIWPEASKSFAKISEAYTKQISGAPIGLLREQRDQRLNFIAAPEVAPRIRRKVI